MSGRKPGRPPTGYLPKWNAGANVWNDPKMMRDAAEAASQQQGHPQQTSQRPELSIKVCAKCREPLPATRYYFHRHKRGLHPRCQACRGQQSVTVNREANLRKRKTLVQAYGSRCACCGAIDSFAGGAAHLQIAHYNGEGGQHRKGRGAYTHLFQAGLRAEAVHLLCLSCHKASGRLDFCTLHLKWHGREEDRLLLLRVLSEQHGL
jgi:hypothetical protein